MNSKKPASGRYWLLVKTYGKRWKLNSQMFGSVKYDLSNFISEIILENNPRLTIPNFAIKDDLLKVVR